MIIPLRLANGLWDIAHLSEWTAICDRCAIRRSIGECSEWAIGDRSDGRIYCPPCVGVVATELLAAVFLPRLPAARYREELKAARAAKRTAIVAAVGRNAVRWLRSARRRQAC
jgi:hypothetical protein